MANRVCAAFGDLWADRRGATLILVGLAATVLIGFSGLAIDVAAWEVAHHNMQGAADQAAYSAVIAGGGTNGATEAKAAAASMGFVDEQNGVSVTVNQPPAAPDPNNGNDNAVQVIISQPQPRYFTNLFLSSPPTVSASSVAAPHGGGPCVVALDPTANGAATDSGSAVVNMPNCDLEVKSSSADALDISGGATLTVHNSYIVGNCDSDSASSCDATGMSASGQNKTGVSSSTITDPFANTTAPPAGPCGANPTSPTGGGSPSTYNTPSAATTIYPGVYCGGISVKGPLTMSPGVYILTKNGGFDVSGGSNDTLSSGSPPTCSGPNPYANGNGVTIYLTGSNSNGKISISSCVALTAPTTGNTKGLVFWVDKTVSNSAQDGFTGGSLEYINGSIYDPSRQVKYTGSATTGTSACTTVVADNVVFSGSSSFNSACVTGSGGSGQAKLVE
jgi:Flp pilus assembly protein TadG